VKRLQLKGLIAPPHGLPGFVNDMAVVVMGQIRQRFGQFFLGRAVVFPGAFARLFRQDVEIESEAVVGWLGGD
jgi:hypothetical protein